MEDLIRCRQGGVVLRGPRQGEGTPTLGAGSLLLEGTFDGGFLFLMEERSGFINHCEPKCPLALKGTL